MGEENAAPMRINKVEGAFGQVKVSQGPGVCEKWGAVTKRGQSTGAKGAIVQVDFAIAFSSIPGVTLATHSDIGVWLTEVAAGYFKWTNNSKSADVTIDWIATDAGNS